MEPPTLRRLPAKIPFALWFVRTVERFRKTDSQHTKPEEGDRTLRSSGHYNSPVVFRKQTHPKTAENRSQTELHWYFLRPREVVRLAPFRPSHMYHYNNLPWGLKVLPPTLKTLESSRWRLILVGRALGSSPSASARMSWPRPAWAAGGTEALLKTEGTACAWMGGRTHPPAFGSACGFGRFHVGGLQSKPHRTNPGICSFELRPCRIF